MISQEKQGQQKGRLSSTRFHMKGGQERIRRLFLIRFDRRNSQNRENKHERTADEGRPGGGRQESGPSDEGQVKKERAMEE